MTKYKTVFINGKQYREHRYLMEQKLGRKLKFDEIVHHKDGNGLNNDIDNLELMSRSDHMKHHYKDGTCIGKIYKEKYNYDKKEIIRLYIDEYKSVPSISKILNIKKEALYHYLIKNNIKRPIEIKYCNCGNEATYIKKTICKKCYLKDYHERKNK